MCGLVLETVPIFAMVAGGVLAGALEWTAACMSGPVIALLHAEADVEVRRRRAVVIQQLFVCRGWWRRGSGGRVF